MNKRSAILAKADELINGDRQADYGPPAKNFAEVAAVWSVILGVPVTAEQVCLCMAGLKLVRAKNGYHLDSLTDGCGYLALAGEVADR